MSLVANSTARKYKITEKILHKAAYSREEAAKLRKKICEACGNITPQTLSRWERIKQTDKDMIFGDHLKTIAEILETDINDLFA